MSSWWRAAARGWHTRNRRSWRRAGGSLGQGSVRQGSERSCSEGGDTKHEELERAGKVEGKASGGENVKGKTQQRQRKRNAQ